MLLFRVLAGVYLLIASMVWLALLGPKGAEISAMGGLLAARIFGYACFSFGIFVLLPRIWAWRDDRLGLWTRRFNNSLRTIWSLGGALLLLLGLGMMGFGALQLEASLYLLAVFLVFTGGALVLGGGAQLHAVWRSLKPRIKKAPEVDGVDATNLVLRLAREHQGRLSASEVAADTSLHYKKAAQVLEAMARDNVCRACVSEAGTTFYLFPEFAGPTAKRDILELDEAEHAAISEPVFASAHEVH